MKKNCLLVALLLVCFSPLTALAESETDYVSLSLGYYDILDDQEAADFRAEYRWDKPCLWKLSPFVGVEANSDGSLWGGAGLYSDVFLSDNLYLTPSVGVGAYNDGGSGKDLGHTIEFRSQLELGYEFDSLRRLSVGFGHISNAGLDDNNPGTEILSLYYHIPID